jgi:hypothetical protein
MRLCWVAFIDQINWREQDKALIEHRSRPIPRIQSLAFRILARQVLEHTGCAEDQVLSESENGVIDGWNTVA